ncbi:MAG TPA: c-type cytochrome, partial [Desulfuromonadaceae bacterium]
MHYKLAGSFFLMVAAISFSLSGCGSSGPGSMTAAQKEALEAASIDGGSLYTADCATCHGPLATSSIKGVTVTQIQKAVSSVDAMEKFSSLTTAQMQAIAAALSGSTTTTGSGSTSGTGTIDGAALYTSDCAGCHGPLATSSKKGATATLIQTGISSVSAMSSLSSLSTAQIQAIAAALSGATTTTGSGSTTTAWTPPPAQMPPSNPGVITPAKNNSQYVVFA